MQSRARGGDDLRTMNIKPKAKGRVQAPNGADGAPCRWDELKGGWLESDGTPYDKKAAAARKKARQRAMCEIAISGDYSPLGRLCEMCMREIA